MSFSTINSVFVQDGYVTQYTNLAGSTLLFYDYLLTLDDEIEFIWKKSWSIGKVLFIISRYYSLIASVLINNMALFQSLTESECIRYYHWQAWSGLITCMIVEVILQMRLYALYFLDKKILTLMVVSFIISSGSTASVLFTMFKSGPASIPHNPEVSFCLPDLAIYCYAVWIPRLVFETFLCILALIRGYQFANKETGNPESVLPSGKYLMRVLIRDCIGSYLVMFAVYLTFLIIWVENVKYCQHDFHSTKAKFNIGASNWDLLHSCSWA
ncbi:hypothetical protein GGU10DRAFT_354742 [Lentinula aff. detonsa]|uniref:DUF6533 domain-containing protein n=1 Tax=Lentinula aff. detonsa TaxID=2804958 RepID=A0AA38NM30_9AGAR|nr:hypothetical protein GGU10DRAFT_354742 [Lentinula aff. detonsa]